MYAVGSKGSTDLLDARTLHVTVVSLPILDLMLMQIFLLKVVKKISSPSRYRGCGIRSVSFKGNILTIGTGKGIILFWDLRAQRFLEFAMNSDRAVCLETSKGWLVSYEATYSLQLEREKPHFLHFQQRDDLFLQNLDGIQQQKYSPAIYTHCYDESGTRLFAAGGPLMSGLTGNYIALFQQRMNYCGGLPDGREPRPRRVKNCYAHWPRCL